MADAKIKNVPLPQAGELVETEAGSVRIQDSADDTKFADIGVSSNSNLIVSQVDNMIVQGTDAATFVQIQRSGATSDDTNTGLSLGVNGNDGYIYNRAGTGKLYLASSNSVAITIDAAENATFVANLSCNGGATLGDGVDDAHTINGIVQFATEQTGTPATPGAGAGGKLYVKNDGKLYYLSDDVSETDISSAGGGGGYTVETKSAGFTAVIEYFYIVTGTSGALTVTLPSASAAGSSGKKIGFKFMDAGTHTVTIARNSTDKIDEIAVDLEINAQSSLELISDGTHWFVV